MYNSSIKGQTKGLNFSEHIEIPHKIFFNDMSKNYMCDEFHSCDVIFSEISWPYGYQKLNDSAKNVPDDYGKYISNINRMIEELNKPAFIVCGKCVERRFPMVRGRFPITINSSSANMDGCVLYVWNYEYEEYMGMRNTRTLTDYLAKNFKRCLDPLCGYGEHLLKFNDFVACDINRDCLTYLSVIYEQKRTGNGNSEG